MKATYALVDLFFLIPVVVIFVRAVPALRLRYMRTIAVLLVLTLIFDNLIIGGAVVAYNEAQISGLKLGLAPIEDFGYAVAAGVLVPWLQSLTASRS